MPLPPQVDKFVCDVDKKLHEPGQVNNVLTQIEQKVNVPRLYLVGGFLAVHALYLIFGHFAELLCNVIGFLYPAYMSIKAIETSKKEDDTQWLTYWVVFALFNVVEFFSDVIVGYFPFYWLLKCAFMLYLYLPMTLGAQHLYTKFVKPFILKHETQLDKLANKASSAMHKAGDVARQAYEENVKPN
ncbi:hypothetical protein QR680_009309 [Steinernema hermaphroditum]|uniref:Receptor expression-enhancing protein n=1 Tax=Steinernema hermaphroditum TaxID=289476 RepID=A0AA39IM93_9BILA|nr:hypothetical protein QR680_009309 [Steinernema hermaphroditum]